MKARVRIVAESREAAGLLTAWLPRASAIWIATAWATDGTSASKALWRARQRIQALVVGLDFHQTDPAFLRRFRPYAFVHKVADGTFHPKVYLVRNGTRYRCLIGSSNFTVGGLSRNLESNAVIEGSIREPLFREVVAFIEAARDAGRLLTESEVAAYAVAVKKVRPALKRARKLALGRQAQGTDPRFDVGWDEYVDQLRRAAKRKNLDLEPGATLGYLGVVREVRVLFARHRRLARMTREDRRKIAGLDWDYGYFGGMWGAGRFQNLVNEHPELLDRALRHVRAGLVAKAHLDAFVRDLPSPGVSVATGSRLLAMKRPDLFVCVDAANRAGFSKALGFSAGRLNTWPGYYELHERLWQFSWFRSTRPRGRDRALWDARVALIDALYYEPR